MAHLVGALDQVEVENILAYNSDPIPEDAGKVDTTTWVSMPVMIGQGYLLQTELVWFQDVSMRSIGVSGP